jgi:O-antigen ligase
MQIFELFILLKYFGIRNSVEQVINTLYYFLGIYLIISDAIMILKPSLVIITGNYLVGNKFIVSYLHLFLIVIFLIKSNYERNSIQKIRIKLVLFFIWTFSAAWYVQCATGMVGTAILLIILISPNIIKLIIKSPFIAISVLLISDFILFISNTLLSNKFVIYFVENILGRDMGLSGRLFIYANVLKVIEQRPLWGFGYNQAYERLTELINAVNAQNAILNNVINYGIIGVTLLLITTFFIIYKLKNNNQVFPLIAMLYVYFILSCVEITLENNFITLLAIMYVFVGQSNNEKALNKDSVIIGIERGTQK